MVLIIRRFPLQDTAHRNPTLAPPNASPARRLAPAPTAPGGAALYWPPRRAPRSAPCLTIWSSPNGTVIDGSGAARFAADVGVKDGKIAAIGRIRDRRVRTIDAEGHVVTPGFVDGHTHMDAQIFWDRLGSCSCYHGVTSVVMGNCGFTIAPCREQDADLVFRNLERAEDISRDAMLAGIDWTWETFPEFLDTIDALPKGINYAGYIGHSALRTYVMGERAFSEAPTPDELEIMCALATEAVTAGAIGFSTSRTVNHVTADDRPVASRAADWDEVRAIVNAVGKTGRGIFEIAHEQVGRSPERLREYFDRLRDLAVESGVPQTWGMFSSRFAPDYWRGYVNLVDETCAAGGRMFVQVHSRPLNMLLSFKTQLPFDKWDTWRDIRALPLSEQKAKLRDPDLRTKLIEAANGTAPGGKVVGVEARPPDYDHFYIMDDMSGEDRLLRDVAAERGMEPVDLMIELSLQKDFNQFFRQPAANENQGDVSGNDPASPFGRDLLRLRRPRLADHGQLPANPPARPLGTREGSPDPRRRGAPTHLQHRDPMGDARPRLAPRGHERRPRGVRPGHRGTGNAGGGPRPARRRQAAQASSQRHQEHRRERRSLPYQQRTHRRPGRETVPRIAEDGVNAWTAPGNRSRTTNFHQLALRIANCGRCRAFG